MRLQFHNNQTSEIRHEVFDRERFSRNDLQREVLQRLRRIREKRKLQLTKVVQGNKASIDTESVYLIVKNMKELQQYLFQPDVGYTNVDCGKNFDLVDVVLINGDYRYRPWSSQYLDVCFHSQLQMFTLVRMCLKTDKPLFASGGSMLSYYYLAATDLDRSVEVLNQNPKSRIEDLLDTKPSGLNSMLIDPITGDLYEYNYSLKKWQPKVNAGLHYKNVNEAHPIFKHMNQRKLFIANPVEEEYPLFKGVNVEAIIRTDTVALKS